MNETPAVQRLVAAVAARDFEGVEAAMAAAVRMRSLVPSGPGEVHGPADVAARFRAWFGDADRIEVLGSNAEPIGDRIALGYRFRVHEEVGWSVVEQRAFLDVDPEGRIAGIDLLCSGFREDPAEPAATAPGRHLFDAGTMGCSDGLPAEFRRRIGAIPMGDVLTIETRDPSARQDLPSLARLLGHAVLSVESPGHGRLLIEVERGR
jgi:TusA-related sulfurtransferase